MDDTRSKKDITKNVMDRIKEENRWAIPVHEQNTNSVFTGKFRILVSFLAILFLVGISVSFIFLNPSIENNGVASTQIEEVKAIIKSIDYAKSFSNLNFTVIQESTVASIGEPLLYQPDDKKNSKQMFFILSILGISMVTLFMNWISREE